MMVTEIIPEDGQVSRAIAWSRRFEVAAFSLLIGTLAWAPFPLGSNRAWSWSLLSLLVAACWLLWTLSFLIAPRRTQIALRPFRIPLLLFFAAILWGVVQILPIVPTGWAHPIWQIAADALGTNLGAKISVDPWRTATELMKLLTYLSVAVLAFVLSQRAERAKILLIALLAIFAFYAVYGLVLTLSGFSQTEIFYPSWHYAPNINGPFVGRNNYATYMGMGVIIAAVQLYPEAAKNIVVGRGVRQHLLSTLQYVFGEGVWGILAFLATLSVLIATASRAGFLATSVGLIVVLGFAISLAGRRSTSRWAAVGFGALVVVFFAMLSLGGDTLQSRFYELVEAGGVDQMRGTLWDAASRMIADSPWLGMGLGSFERAYPLYADQLLPFVMDKVHNDYLEFAAGLGLPAAIAWWTALAWCTFFCIRGVFSRRRNRIYPMIAIGVTALVGFHSVFDFSLQIPAVAVTYAAIMGLGVAQSFSTRKV